jgi:hypothetical protein
LAAFIEAPCPTWKGICTGSGNECPITFDPFFVINGVNQNHPANVRAGCRVETWKPEHGHKQEGEWMVATSHGKGHLVACDGSGTVCDKTEYEISQ